MPQITLADEKNRLECGAETTSLPGNGIDPSGLYRQEPRSKRLCVAAMQGRGRAGLYDGKRDGFERFTGWAHQALNIDGARNEKVGNAAAESRL
jgi:hypothetical protein